MPKSKRSGSKSKSKSKSTKCKPGELLRKGFRRKSYVRSEYTRGDGTVVPASHVPGSVVPATCVPDTGKVGRGAKELPPLDDELHLSKFGYALSKPDNERKAALRKASKQFGVRKVMGHLNLIRNYQAMPENKAKFTEDVEYMKDLYDPIRKGKRAPKYDVWADPDDKERYRNKNNRKKSKSKSKSKSSKSKRNQRGGDDTDDDSDYVVDYLPLPKPELIAMSTVINQKKICDDNGCETIDYVYESHNVNGKKIVYYTLDEKDAEDVLQLDQLYYDSDITLDEVKNNISKNRGYMIGVKVDDELEGYCQFSALDNNEVKINWFCANKGFGSTLYVFIEKYFRMNNYVKIIITVSLEGSYSTRRLNFWYAKGFTTENISMDKAQMRMVKDI